MPIAQTGAQPPVPISGAWIELEQDNQGDTSALRIRESSIDELVLGKSMDSASVQRFLHRSLKKQMDAIDAICMPTPEQRRKIQLAARAQIQQFLDRAEELRRPLRAIRLEIIDSKAVVPDELKNINPRQLFLDSLQNGGFFGDETFFGKVLRNTLNEQQAANYFVSTPKR